MEENKADMQEKFHMEEEKLKQEEVSADVDWTWENHVWCDQAKWVWSQSNLILIFFLIDCIHMSFTKLRFTTDPIKIGLLVPKIQAVKGLLK